MTDNNAHSMEPDEPLDEMFSEMLELIDEKVDRITDGELDMDLDRILGRTMEVNDGSHGRHEAPALREFVAFKSMSGEIGYLREIILARKVLEAAKQEVADLRSAVKAELSTAEARAAEALRAAAEAEETARQMIQESEAAHNQALTRAAQMTTDARAAAGRIIADAHRVADRITADAFAMRIDADIILNAIGAAVWLIEKAGHEGPGSHAATAADVPGLHVWRTIQETLFLAAGKISSIPERSKEPQVESAQVTVVQTSVPDESSCSIAERVPDALLTLGRELGRSRVLSQFSSRQSQGSEYWNSSTPEVARPSTPPHLAPWHPTDNNLTVA